MTDIRDGRLMRDRGFQLWLDRRQRNAQIAMERGLTATVATCDGCHLYPGAIVRDERRLCRHCALRETNPMDFRQRGGQSANGGGEGR